ncbi:MAG: DegT/DnrJ/EryC1/StrS family aminotransferase, partial [Candidatus Omnitrophica bacterium]|nr:DegT/DnrJ/EryC1/StrS family aminotransferase [Candidatus Omnitrophota bacterium]
MVITQNEDLYERMQLLRNHGMKPDRRYFHEVAGHNFRMTNLQAALGWAQLQKKDYFCRRRRMITEYYRKFFQKYPNIIFQEIKPSEHPVYWANAIRLEASADHPRDEVMAHLAALGIETRPGFVTFDQMPPYQAHPLPVARSLSEAVICLPTYVTLEKHDLQEICREVKRFTIKEKSLF